MPRIKEVDSRLCPWLFILALEATKGRDMYLRYLVNDRRRFKRVKASLSVFYRVDSPLYARSLVGDKEIEAVTADLGCGGMALLTEYNIPCWSTLLLRFVLCRLDSTGLFSFQAPVQLAAEVHSSCACDDKKYRIGLSFKDLDHDDKFSLHRFVEATL